MKHAAECSRNSAGAPRLIISMCLAQILTMLGVFSFPALLPYFMDVWQLNHGQAGWISGIYFAGYTIAVPVLTSFTDRIDSRKIYIISCLVCVAANLGFARFSQGFWSALLFRSLSGIGLAGTFIPGLKALIDRVDARYLQRVVSFYTACFGLGMSLSFYYSGVIHTLFGWRAVFSIAAACSAAAMLMSRTVLVPGPREQGGATFTSLMRTLDFRPVWQNTCARQYIIAYMCHMWEMFAARSWMVAFLTFSLTRHAASAQLLAPTTIMAMAGVFGMMASIGFGELAVRFGRKKIVAAVMTLSGTIGLTIGFTAESDYLMTAGLCVLYTLFFQGDSAAIHAGVITAADPKRQGATMALQSLAGFGAASLSPIVAGLVLDMTGAGHTTFSWGITFAVMAASAFAGLFQLLKTA